MLYIYTFENSNVSLKSIQCILVQSIKCIISFTNLEKYSKPGRKSSTFYYENKRQSPSKPVAFLDNTDMSDKMVVFEKERKMSILLSIRQPKCKHKDRSPQCFVRFILNPFLRIVYLLFGLIWYLCLMAYQPSCVNVCQSHSCRKTAVELFDFIAEGIREV